MNLIFLLKLFALALTFAAARSANQHGQGQQEQEDKAHVNVSARCAAVLIVAGGAAGSAATWLVLPHLLGLLGFAKIGVTAGSAAAKWQSTMPLVSSGSLFSTLQSIAMGGASKPVAVAVGGFVGTIPTAAFIEKICIRVDNVNPESPAGKAVALAVTIVQKADEGKEWAEKMADKLGIKEHGDNLRQRMKATTNWISKKAEEAGFQQHATNVAQQAGETFDWIMEQADDWILKEAKKMGLQNGAKVAKKWFGNQVNVWKNILAKKIDEDEL